ncbi:MAG TPA: acyl carrier protein [Symbiobacteriaceae bacterium]
MDEIKARVRSFLSRFFRKYELQDDEDIFSLGVVNSLFAMQLVLFIEKQFGVKVENQDLNLNNFRTIAAIASFVESKQAKAG